MTPALVYLHGRSQEFKDPDVLRREWTAALNAGLTRAGAPTTDDNDTFMPYYANALYRMVAELARNGDSVDLEALPLDPDQPGPLHPELPSHVGSTEQELVTDMAYQAGMATPEGLDTVLAWGPARTALRWLADHTRIDQQLITGYLRDVAVYLTHAREPILQIVRGNLPDHRPIVLVSHSLGSVVARDLLDDDDVRTRTLMWLTLGSPLAVDTVQKNLRTPGFHNPGLPWINVYDDRDIVALGHPFRPLWGAPLHDLEVQNGAEPHSITKYLAHPEVAQTIGELG